MSYFYQPTSTVGIYDAKEKRLTVNWGTRAIVGFRATPPKRLADIDVDATDADAVTARYVAGPNAVELEINTSRPGRFILEAREDHLPVVEPLQIVAHYENYEFWSPCGQWSDASACWAACLCWWLGVQSAKNRVPMTFFDLLKMFSKVWNKDGTINDPALLRGLQRNDGHFSISPELIQAPSLPSYLGRWPLIVAFRTPNGTGHMNVLYAYDAGRGLVSAMEPWWPDPGDDGVITTDGIMFLRNPDFVFRGTYVRRPVRYYMNPLNSGLLFVAFPKEYKTRMPMRA